MSDIRIQTGDIVNSITFSVKDRWVVRLFMTGDDVLHIEWPDDLLMTDAARAFLEVVRDQMPKLFITAHPQGHA